MTIQPPIELRCEYHWNPLGLDVLKPRLSWQMNSTDRGARQTAYQVLVATSEAVLQDQRGDLWDSGKISSDQSVHLLYNGPALSSGQRVWWTVRIWDAQEQVSAWSLPAWWEMGLLSRDEWIGHWVGASSVGGVQTTAPCPYLRKDFTIDQPIVAARLYITALGLYECEINGSRVGNDEFRPGWTDYHQRVQYQTYDVTDVVQNGTNTIGAILGDGWYCGHVEWRGRQRYGDRPKLLAQLVIKLADNSTRIVATDNSWQTTTGPLLESDMLMGESYDARHELGAWSSPGYDSSRWLPVEVFADPNIEIAAQRGPAVTCHEELTPVAEPTEIKQGPQSKWIFDLGQNMVGRVRLNVQGEAGTTITLRHGEILNADGTLYTANLRTAKQIDHYTLRGNAEEVYEPRFTFHGFRYVEVSGYEGIPRRDLITGIVLHSATPPTGTFECSDPLINQLQHNIQWGQKGNFLDVPTDCPQRDERLGWTGDAQVFVRTAAFNMDVASFFDKWMQDVADAQSEAGAVPPVVPNTGIAGSDGGPAWADAAIIVPWTIYQCYGDTRLLADRYELMTRFVDYLHQTSVNLIRVHPDHDSWGGYGDWLAQDGTGKTEGGTPKDLIGTAFFAHSARLLSKIAEVLGKTEDAVRFEQLFSAVRQAFQRRFVTPEGLVIGQTQTAYVLALHFDLLQPEHRSIVAAALVRDIERRGMHLSTGFVGTPYLPHVLMDTGHIDVAYALLNQKTWPSWLYPVTQGATTIWERWDGWTHDKGFQDAGMNSFNHYAYGAVGAWLYGVVAGIEIDPQQPGYKHIILRPRPGGGLTFAKAELRTMYGTITSDWQLDSTTFYWTIMIPPNTRATVHVPASADAIITENGRPLHNNDHVSLIQRADDVAVYAIEAGQYRLQVESQAE